MSFPHYQNYFDSGVEWLGKLPAHWSALSLKYAFKIVGGSTPKSDVDKYWDGGIPWITPADLSRLSGPVVDGSIRTITEEGLASCATTKVPPGSVILSTRAPIGSLAITGVDACTNQGCKALVPNGRMDSRLLAYCLSIATEQLNVRGKGTTFLELSADELGLFRIPAPPSSEQPAIVQFLDWETGKIDALVEEQRRLIDLLKEKRQAIISHAVTKGLDSIAAIKNSGVDWLGDVPAHWQLTKLKHLASLKSGGTPSKDNLGYWSGDIPWASAKDLKSDDLADTIDHITEAAISDGAAQLAPPGSVVVLVRGMMLARTFPVVRILVPMAINQDLKALNGRQGVSNEYLAWLLRGTAPETLNRLDEAGHGTKALRMEAWLSMPVPLPPLAEQERIVAFIRTELGKLDALVTEAATAVTLLQERSSALISAAVTGRIDVRSLAPAEAEAA